MNPSQQYSVFEQASATALGSVLSTVHADSTLLQAFNTSFGLFRYSMIAGELGQAHPAESNT